MLLLVALGNVTWWRNMVTTDPARISPADRVVIYIRTALVDQRAYPLFALLFGFGLQIMTNRIIAAKVASGEAPTQAAAHARRVVLRRSVLLIAFGAVHGLVFPGDIIGAYGIAGILLAHLIANHKRVAVAVAMIAFALMVLVVRLSDVAQHLGPSTFRTEADSLADKYGLVFPLDHLFEWAMTVASTLLANAVLPSICLGVLIAGTQIIQRPAKHLKLLTATAVLGLGAGVISAIPHARGLIHHDLDGAGAIANAIFRAGGVFGALGWLAAIAAAVGYGFATRGAFARVTTAVGRRSMTCYLGQTLLFLLVFSTSDLLGITNSIGDVEAVFISLLAYGITAAYALHLDKANKRGPAESLLRDLAAIK